MDDLFEVADATAPVRQVEIEDELSAPDLAVNPPATLFRLSSEPYLVRGKIRDLVEDEDDALIAVHQGTLVLACHHSSGWIVCRSG